MSTPRKIFLGLLTLIPLLLLVTWFMIFTVMFPSGQHMKQPEDVRSLGYLVGVIFITGFVSTVSLMIYYIVHSARNKAFSRDIRNLWIVILIFGCFIAMPVYWYQHIWKGGAGFDAPPRRVRNLSKRKKLVLGAVSLLPILYVMAIPFLFGALAILHQGLEDGNDPPLFFRIMMAGHISLFGVILFLLVYYVVDIFRNDAVRDDRKALWAAILFLSQGFGAPVYWFLYIWREPMEELPENPAVAPAAQIPQGNISSGG